MKIVVCIKQVPSSGKVTVDPVTHHLIREKNTNMMNPSDFNALEAALQLKEKILNSTYGDGEEVPSCEIAAITMGPSDAQEILRTALAMGVDEAILVSDRCLAGGDTIATSVTLAAAIKACGAVDLVIAGAESSDGATGQVGPMIAEILQIPHITSVSHTNMCACALEVTKKFRQSKVRLRTKLPALITVEYGSNEPRLTTLRSQMAAKKKNITVLTNQELKLPSASVGAEGSTTVVAESFRPEIIASCEFLSGTPREIAGQIAALIDKERGSGT